ncbi:MAG: preprotein translocase subunit SecG [Aquihabitans sp.]
MITALVILHVIVSLAMLGLVLLHSGKGGGLSDMFGGGMGAAAQGSTMVEKNLDRATVLMAVIFTFTTMSLGLLMSSSV